MLALITGGNRGIGLSIARSLAKDGMDIIIVGRNKKTLDSAKEELEGLKVKVWAIACDISDNGQVKNLASQVREIGAPGILINNAAVAYNRYFEETSEKEISLMIDVNLRGLIMVSREILPLMEEGLLINISSGAGKQGFPGLAVYCATKFGVIGFTQALAEELKDTGMRAYAICPADTQTDMWESLHPGTPATYRPEDVAKEVINLIRNNKRIRPGSAISVQED
jgi:short-subunit dehydrogenase